MSRDSNEKMREKKENQMKKISLVSVLIVILFIIEIYEIMNDSANLIAIGVIGAIIIAAVYVETSLIHGLSVHKEKEQEEAYNNVYRSEKASYLLMRKYFDQMSQKMAELDKKSEIPYQELVTVQKAIAKVQISRNKENTEALIMNYNEKMLQKIVDFQKTLENMNVSGFANIDKEALTEGNKDILLKQQEILTGLKEMESSIKNEILKSANKMSQSNGLTDNRISYPESNPIQQMESNDLLNNDLSNNDLLNNDLSNNDLLNSDTLFQPEENSSLFAFEDKENNILSNESMTLPPIGSEENHSIVGNEEMALPPIGGEGSNSILENEGMALPPAGDEGSHDIMGYEEMTLPPIGGEESHDIMGNEEMALPPIGGEESNSILENESMALPPSGSEGRHGAMGNEEMALPPIGGEGSNSILENEDMILPPIGSDTTTSPDVIADNILSGNVSLPSMENVDANLLLDEDMPLPAIENENDNFMSNDFSVDQLENTGNISLKQDLILNPVKDENRASNGNLKQNQNIATEKSKESELDRLLMQMNNNVHTNNPIKSDLLPTVQELQIPEPDPIVQETIEKEPTKAEAKKEQPVQSLADFNPIESGSIELEPIELEPIESVPSLITPEILPIEGKENQPDLSSIEADSSETATRESDPLEIATGEADLPEIATGEADLSQLVLPEADIPESNSSETTLPEINIPEIDSSEVTIPELNAFPNIDEMSSITDSSIDSFDTFHSMESPSSNLNTETAQEDKGIGDIEDDIPDLESLIPDLESIIAKLDSEEPLNNVNQESDVDLAALDNNSNNLESEISKDALDAELEQIMQKPVQDSFFNPRTEKPVPEQSTSLSDKRTNTQKSIFGQNAEIPEQGETASEPQTNRVMNAEEIAALISNTDLINETKPDNKKSDTQDFSDPGHMMTPEEIAALIANL